MLPEILSLRGLTLMAMPLTQHKSLAPDFGFAFRKRLAPKGRLLRLVRLGLVRRKLLISIRG